MLIWQYAAKLGVRMPSDVAIPFLGTVILDTGCTPETKSEIGSRSLLVLKPPPPSGGCLKTSVLGKLLLVYTGTHVRGCVVWYYCGS